MLYRRAGSSGIHRFTECGIRPSDFQDERTGQAFEPAPLQFRSTEDVVAMPHACAASKELVCVAGLEPASSASGAGALRALSYTQTCCMDLRPAMGRKRCIQLVKEQADAGVRGARAVTRAGKAQTKSPGHLRATRAFGSSWVLLFAQAIGLHECPGCPLRGSRLTSGRARSPLQAANAGCSSDETWPWPVPSARVPAAWARPSGRGSRVMLCSTYIVRVIRLVETPHSSIASIEGAHPMRSCWVLSSLG